MQASKNEEASAFSIVPKCSYRQLGLEKLILVKFSKTIFGFTFWALVNKEDWTQNTGWAKSDTLSWSQPAHILLFTYIVNFSFVIFLVLSSAFYCNLLKL